jgi:hypothetical protein
MMSGLEGIRKGRNPRPPKVLIYGGVKTGKSTFGASIPNAIFIQTEEGLDALDVHAFPMAKTWVSVRDSLRALAQKDHEYKALVIDSIDWLEPLIWDYVCQQHGCESIEQVGGGYGKGYTEANVIWRQFLAALDYLRDNKGMSIVLIGHDEIRKMEPVDSEAYDYAAIKLNKKAAALVQEWADVIGYAKLKTLIKSADQGFGKKTGKALAPGDVRELHVGKNPAYVSGNRYGIADTLLLEWSALRAAIGAGLNPTTTEDNA